MPGGILIKGGNAFMGEDGILKRDILISGTRIAKVAEDIPAAEADRVMDVPGKLVTPGLIDYHMHAFRTTSAWGRLTRAGRFAVR